jgi:hypothetical protein
MPPRGRPCVAIVGDPLSPAIVGQLDDAAFP